MDTDLEAHECRYHFSKTFCYKKYIKDKEERRRLYIFAVALCIKLYTDKEVNDKYVEDTFIKIFNYNGKNALQKAYELINSKRMRNIMGISIAEIAESAGITKEWYFKQMRDIAEKSKYDNVRLDALKDLKPIIGIQAIEKPKSLFGSEISDGDFRDVERPELKNKND